ncbi:hypothetical protein ACKKBF_B17270 [Auxenochlorella protothecoides x Auxenochlorella symbiontica]
MGFSSCHSFVLSTVSGTVLARPTHATFGAPRNACRRQHPELQLRVRRRSVSVMASQIPEEYLPAAAKGLVFDLDGTVMDTMSAHWRAWTDVTRELGLTITPEQFLGFAGRPTSGIFASLCEEQGKTIDIPAAVELKNARYHEVADDTKLVKPVVEILQAALARGLPCAIATGGDRFQVYPSLAKSGLWTPDNTSNFKAVVTCTDVTHGKPHPETYLKAAALLGVDPADCVGYEDAPLGMESIRRAGFLAAVDVTKIPGYPTLDI